MSDQLHDILKLLDGSAMLCGIEAEDDHMSTLLIKDGEQTHRFIVKGEAPLFCTLRPIRTIFGAWVVLPLDSPTDSYAAYPSRMVKVLDEDTIQIAGVMRAVDTRKMGDWTLSDFVRAAQHKESSQMSYPTTCATTAWMLHGHEVYDND